MKKYYKFNLDSDSVNVTDEQDSRFARLDIDICSTEPNSHNIIFTGDALKRASETLFMMPVLASFNERIKDVEGHETDEVGLGGFFNKKEIFVEEKNGITYIKGIAYLWKNYPYVQDVLDCLRKRNGEASVSMEIEVTEDDMSADKSSEVLVKDFVFQGVTILGKHVEPAIKSSHLQILSFSALKEEYEKDYAKSLERRYDDIDFKVPSAVVANAKKAIELLNKYQRSIGLNSLSMAKGLAKGGILSPAKAKAIFKYLSRHKDDVLMKKEPFNDEYFKWMCYGGSAALKWSQEIIQKMKEADEAYTAMFAIEIGSGKHYPLSLDKGDIDDGEWDDRDVRRLAIEDPDFLIIAPKIFMKLEDGWENGGVEKLKYPIASVVDGKWKYNKKAISSALGYATKEGETKVEKKIKSLFSDNEVLDAENQLLVRKEETDKAKEEVEKAEGENMADEELKNKDVKEEETGKELEEKLEDKLEDKPEDKPEGQPENKPDETPKGEEEGEIPEDDGEDKESNKENDEDKEVKPNFEEYFEKLKPILEKEAEVFERPEEELKEFVREVFEYLKGFEEACTPYMAEKKELEEFKCGVEESEKMAAVNRVLEEEVKEDLSDEEKEALRCEAKEFSFANISVWENRVKAKAYENSHKKKAEPKEKKETKFANPWQSVGVKATQKTIWETIK